VTIMKRASSLSRRNKRADHRGSQRGTAAKGGQFMDALRASIETIKKRNLPRRARRAANLPKGRPRADGGRRITVLMNDPRASDSQMGLNNYAWRTQYHGRKDRHPGRPALHEVDKLSAKVGELSMRSCAGIGKSRRLAS